MKFVDSDNGIYFKFEKKDWRGDWRSFIDWVKSGTNRVDWTYNVRPGWFWVCRNRVRDLYIMKQHYIDNYSD